MANPAIPQAEMSIQQLILEINRRLAVLSDEIEDLKRRLTANGG